MKSSFSGSNFDCISIGTTTLEGIKVTQTVITQETLQWYYILPKWLCFSHEPGCVNVCHSSCCKQMLFGGLSCLSYLPLQPWQTLILPVIRCTWRNNGGGDNWNLFFSYLLFIWRQCRLIGWRSPVVHVLSLRQTDARPQGLVDTTGMQETDSKHLALSIARVHSVCLCVRDHPCIISFHARMFKRCLHCMRVCAQST